VRVESDRELAAATQRRDSINAQLANVRQMLATLTGSASGFAVDPLPGVGDVVTETEEPAAEPQVEPDTDVDADLDAGADAEEGAPEVEQATDEQATDEGASEAHDEEGEQPHHG
jgi:hypothetical protein